VIDIVRDISYTEDGAGTIPQLAFEALTNMPILSREEMTTGYYIRLNAEDQTGVLADVTTILSRAGISIDAIMQQSRLKDLIPIVILTDPIVESKMDEALAQIQALPAIRGEIVSTIMSNANRYTGLVDRYRDRLPVSATTRAISLGEGNTPLIKLENIPRIIGKNVEIYVKYEGLNPTGSFKDRGMTMAVTKAVEEGSKAIICASTGNTSAAAAAYAARAGIKAFVLIPEGKIAMGKMAQAMMYGAITMQIRGNFDDGMRLVKEVADQAPVTIVNSINPRPKNDCL